MDWAIIVGVGFSSFVIFLGLSVFLFTDTPEHPPDYILNQPEYLEKLNHYSEVCYQSDTTPYYNSCLLDAERWDPWFTTPTQFGMITNEFCVYRNFSTGTGSEKIIDDRPDCNTPAVLIWELETWDVKIITLNETRYIYFTMGPIYE